MTALEALAARLRAEGGLLGDAVAGPAADALSEGASPGEAVAARGSEYSLLVEAVREGYLLHYAQGRVLRTPDPDLALLAGDRLYALGLDRLADLGDLDGVAVLADLISECARAHAEGDPARAQRAWSDGTARLAG
ncbi:MAG: hypothetical protein QOE65_2371 [Solirubrobacteraceae bacterium]|jgi:hypothetical protein|nr:hypothetical protein [Solirubrobacteraceae bacterium]